QSHGNNHQCLQGQRPHHRGHHPAESESAAKMHRLGDMESARRRRRHVEDSMMLRTCVLIVCMTTTSMNACRLLNKADFARVTGSKFQEGVTTNDYLGVSQCRFNVAGDPNGGAMVALHLQGNLDDYRKV